MTILVRSVVNGVEFLEVSAKKELKCPQLIACLHYWLFWPHAWLVGSPHQFQPVHYSSAGPAGEFGV